MKRAPSLSRALKSEVQHLRFEVRCSRFKRPLHHPPSPPPTLPIAIRHSPLATRHSPLATRHSVIFACPRTALESLSRRWCRASAFPSHAGNRHNTGRPTEAHEDMFTGPQHTLTLRGNLRFPYEVVHPFLIKSRREIGNTEEAFPP